MIADTSALLSAWAPDQRHHESCARVLSRARRVVVSPFVLAELDYLLRTRVGADAELRMLVEVASGAFTLPHFETADVTLAREVIAAYANLDLGLTDASLVVLAHRYRTPDLLTLDERHFRTVVGLDDEPFRLLPADA